MNKFALFGLILAGSVSLLATEASAVVCAKGVYRAGCVGPSGAVVGRATYRGGVIAHGHMRSGTTVRRYSGRHGSRTTIRHY